MPTLSLLAPPAAAAGLVIAAVTVSSAPAQTTWVVAAGGGGNFTDIPAAIAAAAPGDRITVLPGAYSSFSIALTHLTVEAFPGVTVGSAGDVIRIDLVDGPTLVRGFTSPAQVSVSGSTGQVHLESLRLGGGIRLVQSGRVSLQAVTATATAGEALHTASSGVVLHRCDLRATAVGAPAMTVLRGRVAAAETVLVGGPGNATVGPGPGVAIRDATLAASGGPGASIAAGTGGPLPAPAVDGQASTSASLTTVRTDFGLSLVPVNGAGLVEGPVTWIATTVPWTDASVVAGQLATAVHAPAGSASVLVAGLPAAPIAAGPLGTWFVGTPWAVLQAGTIGGGGSLTGAFPIPVNAPLTPLALQAAVLLPTGSATLTLPAMRTLAP